MLHGITIITLRRNILSKSVAYRSPQDTCNLTYKQLSQDRIKQVRALRNFCNLGEGQRHLPPIRYTNTYQAWWNYVYYYIILVYSPRSTGKVVPYYVIINAFDVAPSYIKLIFLEAFFLD